MNDFINKILKEVEDSSDEFFQSKHVNKRKEKAKRAEREVLVKLKNGIEKIKMSYNNKNWKNEKEELFLKLFSKLHVDSKLYQNEYIYAYFLADSDNKVRCFYDLRSNRFWIDYASIWNVFRKQFNINYRDTQSFVNMLLREYFKLYDVTSTFRHFGN